MDKGAPNHHDWFAMQSPSARHVIRWTVGYYNGYAACIMSYQLRGSSSDALRLYGDYAPSMLLLRPAFLRHPIYICGFQSDAYVRRSSCSR